MRPLPSRVRKQKTFVLLDGAALARHGAIHLPGRPRRAGAAGRRWPLGRGATAVSARPPDVNPAVKERVFELDRKWFERHPGRAYRLRRPVPGEIDASAYPRASSRSCW